MGVRELTDAEQGERPSRVDVVAEGPTRAGPAASLHLGLRWIPRNARILFLVGVSILCAAILFGVIGPTIVLVDAVQFQTALTANGAANNIDVRISTADYDAGTIDSLASRAESAGQRALGGLAPRDVRYLEFGTGEYAHGLLLTQINGEQILTADPAFPLVLTPVIVPEAYDLTQALPHMRLLAGTLPSGTPVNGIYDVLAPDGAGLRPGDILDTMSAPAYSAQIIGNTGPQTIQVPVKYRVSGIWTERTPGDLYWNGQHFLNVPINVDAVKNGPPPLPTQMRLVMPESTFLTTLASVPTPGFFYDTPTLPPDQFILHVTYIPDFTAITPSTLGQRADQVDQFRQGIAQTLDGSAFITQAQVVTGLPTILGTLGQGSQQFVLQLAGAVALVGALVLLFMAVMANLLVISQTPEIAVLASRGASRLQTCGALVVQTLPVALLTLLVAPVLSVALAVLFVQRALLANASYHLVPLSTALLVRMVPWQSVLPPVVVGVLLALVVVALMAARAGMGNVLTQRLSVGRGAGRPLWQRLYLDVLLAVLAGVAYYELATSGGIASTSAASATSAIPALDPVRALAPLLMLLAGALLALRLLPLVARVGRTLASRGRGAANLLAFAQAEHSTTRLLAVLLTCAVSVSFFALCFQATATRNAVDRAGYLVGSDERVVLDESLVGGISTSTLSSKFAALPGVSAVSPVYRDLLTDTDGNVNYPTLAVDPATFGQVAAWRGDYASVPLASLLGQMRAASDEALAQARSSGGRPVIWSLVSTLAARQLHIHVGQQFSLGSNGKAFTFVAGAVVDNWPTLDPYGNQAGSGFIVADLPTYLIDLGGTPLDQPPAYTPNEFWLRTTPDARLAAARAATLTREQYELGILTTYRQSDIFAQLTSDPGQQGFVFLLFASGVGGVALALLAALVQWSLLARRQKRQLAVLRTLGMRPGEIRRMLLGKQSLLYGFGLVVGTALGALLVVAVVPLFQTGGHVTSDVAPAVAPGIPPYFLVYPSRTLAVAYAVLLALVLASLLVLTWLIQRGHLSTALRVGED